MCRRMSFSPCADRLDDPEMYDGAPVGIQIVGRKFEEEKVLSIAKIITSAMETLKAKGMRATDSTGQS